MKKDTAEWLEIAAEDLKVADLLAERGHAEAAAFHAQQAGEKALKAVLIERTGRYPRIHDVVQLAREAKAPESLGSPCERLSLAYVASRYPGAGNAVSDARARQLVEDAQEVTGWARRQIS
ncbi:MAG: HEPN domain-containing protein [Methanobacteriota archaeon]